MEFCFVLYLWILFEIWKPFTWIGWKLMYEWVRVTNEFAVNPVLTFNQTKVLVSNHYVPRVLILFTEFSSGFK